MLLGCWGVAGWALRVVIAAKNIQRVLLLLSSEKSNERCRMLCEFAYPKTERREGSPLL